MKTLLLLLAINWNADLTRIAEEVPKVHPNPFRTTTREAFLADVEQLRARAPELQPHEVMVEMARIVATVNDGHTRLALPIDDAHQLFHRHVKTALPKDSSLWFHVIPQRFTIRGEALFLSDGRRVTRVGKMSAEEAIAALKPVAPADNEWQRKDFVGSYMSVLEILHARKVIDSLTGVPIVFADGSAIVAKPSAAGAAAAPQEPWRFEYLAEQKAVYFDYDEVSNAKTETLAQFAERMFRFIDEQPVEKLIIDMRDNYGGNGTLNRSLLHGLIRAKKLQAPGTLFVLVGRRTFSAAMMFATDLEQHTHAIFLGEPTAGAPNSYGDSRKIVLPESGLTLRVSSLYWQQSDPRDTRDTLTPHFLSETPMDIALNYFGAPASEGTWEGVMSVEFRRIPITVVNGAVTTPEWKDYKFALRTGTKRMAGTMTLGGIEYLVTGER
ncbi:MAG TPA: hypothetical protein VF846_19940 [Thermoanaerobaculia bacterium]|jgi:hypothetical protein